MAVYQRGSNWYIDFTFHGQRIREMIGPSRKGAQKVIDKRKAEIAENKFLDVRKEPEAITFHEFAKEYLPISLANRKQSVKIKQRELSLLRGLDSEFGEKKLDEITNWNIEQWKKQRREEIEPASVNRQLAVLKSIFAKAVEWGKLKENPAKRVKLFKTQGRVRYLMPDEVELLLSNCAGCLKDIVTIAVHTGMRKSEILTLRKTQVNFETGLIALDAADTKNQERRYVPMDETVKATLRALEGAGEYYFMSIVKRGEPTSRVDRGFRSALKASKIEDFKFHDLRHTFASNLVMNGAQLNDVRELLGQKSMAMVMRYAHLSPKHKAKVVNILDGVFASVTQSPTEAKVEVAKVVNLYGEK